MSPQWTEHLGSPLPFELYILIYCTTGCGGSDGKESACNAEDSGSIPGSQRSPGEGNGNPVQYSCLENSMDRGVWWATIHGVRKSRTQLSNQHFHFHRYMEKNIKSIFSYTHTNLHKFTNDNNMTVSYVTF